MAEAAFTPALMGEGDAAFYIGVSASTLVQIIADEMERTLGERDSDGGDGDA